MDADDRRADRRLRQRHARLHRRRRPGRGRGAEPAGRGGVRSPPATCSSRTRPTIASARSMPSRDDHHQSPASAPCTADCPALGDGGPATSAFISLPQGQSARPAGRIDIDATGNLYIADTLNHRVAEDRHGRHHHDHRGQRADGRRRRRRPGHGGGAERPGGRGGRAGRPLHRRHRQRLRARGARRRRHRDRRRRVRRAGLRGRRGPGDAGPARPAGRRSPSTPPATSTSRTRTTSGSASFTVDVARATAILAAFAPPHADRTVTSAAPPPPRASSPADGGARVPGRRLRLDAKQAPAVDGAAAATPPAPKAVDATGFRTAIDLYANRVHAVLHRDGRLVVDAGGLDFLKYVDGGWKTSWLLGAEGRGPARRAGRRPVGDGVPPRRRTTARVRGDATLSITMRALAPQQRVSLFVNEKPLSTLEVDKASKRYDVVVPAALLHAGDNRVRMTFKSAADMAGGKRAAAAVTSLALGPASLRAASRTRSRRSPRARSTSAARAAARWCRAAPGSRAVVLHAASGGRAPGVRLRRRARPAARWSAQVAVDGKPARTRARGQRRRPAGPTRSSISAPPAARRRAST